jgi:sporulation protein YlmC with PRC-barrel domain
MKNYRVTLASVVSAVVLAGTLATMAQQADPADPFNRNRKTGDTQSGTAGASRNLSQLDDKTRGATIRASQLIGQDLKNSKGENVGEINDLVIDASGKVRYAAVKYGGVLGVGSKLFAVPFEAFRVGQDPDDPDDPDDYVLTLDVTKEQLDGAHSFDDDQWPDFADTKFTQELDRRYKVDRSQTRNPTRQ